MKLWMTSAVLFAVVLSSKAELVTAGDLLVDLDASKITAAEGAVVSEWPNLGTLGGAFIQTKSGGTGVTFSLVNGVPSVSFAGSDASVLTNTVPPPASILGAESWSVEGWVFNASYSSTESYFSWTPRNGLPSNICTVQELRYGSSVLGIEHYSYNIEVGATEFPVPGTWVHIAVTRDANGEERLFINGQRREVGSFALQLPDDGSLTVGGVFNRESKNFGNYFSGAIARLRVHDGTLTDAQVFANYAEEAATFSKQWIGAVGVEADAADGANWSDGKPVVDGDVLNVANGGIMKMTGGTVYPKALRIADAGLVLDGGAKILVTNQLENLFFGGRTLTTLAIPDGVLRYDGSKTYDYMYIGLSGARAEITLGGKGSDVLGQLFCTRDMFVSYSRDVRSETSLTLLPGGDFSVSNGWPYLAMGPGAYGYVTNNGGTINSRARYSTVPIASQGGHGELVQNAGFLNANSALAFSYSTPPGFSRFRMNGGEALIGSFSKEGSTKNTSTNLVELNGGVIRSARTEVNWLTDLTKVTVLEGGITLDIPEGQTVTIAQNLLEDPDSPGGVIRKTGAGRLILTGTNTISTALEVQGGTVFFQRKESMAAFSAIHCADGAGVSAQWTGGAADLLAKISADDPGKIILTAVNLNDPVDFTGRPNAVLSFDGSFTYEGVFTPFDGNVLALDILSGTLTYDEVIADGAAPKSLRVTGTSAGTLKLTADNSFTGGTMINSANVIAETLTAFGASGTVELTNHPSVTFCQAQPMQAFLNRLTKDSDGVLLMSIPAVMTEDLDLSTLPGVVLGTAFSTNILYSAKLTPAGTTYRFGGGKTGYSGPYTGLTLTNLTDTADGAACVVGGDPGIFSLGAGNTYSGGTLITNNAILHLKSDGLGALPETEDPDNLVINGGVLRPGNAIVTIPAVRGFTVTGDGARIHQWGSSIFTWLGNLYGDGPITVSDTGWHVFAGADNRYTGKLKVSSGSKVRIGNGTTYSWPAEVGAQTDGILALNSDQDWAVTQTFTGSGILRKEGTGTMTLSAPQEYYRTEVAEGILRVAGQEALPPLTTTRNAGMTVSGTGTFETDGQGLRVAVINGDGVITNRTGLADTLYLGTENKGGIYGLFTGTLDPTIRLVMDGVNTQYLMGTKEPVPEIEIRRGTVDIQNGQVLDVVQLERLGELRVGAESGLPGSFYKLGSAPNASMIASLDAIAAFEAANTLTEMENSTAMGTGFDTQNKGQGFPDAFINTENYIAVWRGSFYAEEAGEYTFALRSDDGSVLFLNGALVVDNNKDQGYDTGNQRVDTRKTVTLSRGLHPIVIAFYEKSGENAVTAYVTRPGQTEDEILPNSLLCAGRADTVTVNRFTKSEGVLSFSPIGFAGLNLPQEETDLSAQILGGSSSTVMRKSGPEMLTFSGVGSRYEGCVEVEAGTVALAASGVFGKFSLDAGASMTSCVAAASSKGLTMWYYDNVKNFDYTAYASHEALMGYVKGLTPALITDSLLAGTTLDFGSSGERFHKPYSTASTDYFLVVLQGSILLAESGTYGFSMDSDDGGVIFIDGERVVSRAFDTGMSGSFGTKGTIDLLAGSHSITIAFYEKAGGQGLRVGMRAPSATDYAYIPQEKLLTAPTVLGVNGAVGSTLALGDAALNVFVEDTATFAGELSGTEASLLQKAGMGTNTIVVAQPTFAGTVEVVDGVLRFAEEGDLSAAKVLRVSGNGTLLFDRAGTVEVPALAGDGTVVVDGGCTVVVANATFTGDVRVKDGVYRIARSGITLLSSNVGSISGETMEISGGGVASADLPSNKVDLATIRVRDGSTVVVSNEENLGGAEVALANGTLAVSGNALIPGATVLADFSDTSLWKVNGVANFTAPGELQLSTTAGSVSGSAFRKEPFSLRLPWCATFHYQMTKHPTMGIADGFSFMIQNDSAGASAIGATGGAIAGAVTGSSVITPAVAAVFNIYNASKFSWTKNGIRCSSEVSPNGIDFHSTAGIDVKIAYNGFALLLQVIQDGKVFEQTLEINLADHLGSETGYIGFTGSTGGSVADQRISNFSIRNIQESTDFTTTTVRVEENMTGSLTVDTAAFEMGGISMEKGASLNLQTVSGENTDYQVQVNTLQTAENATVHLFANGTGKGTLALSRIDATAGGTISIRGGKVSAPGGVLTIVIPNPFTEKISWPLRFEDGAVWEGALPEIILVDASGNVVEKIQAGVSEKGIFVSTCAGTLMIIR